MSVIQTTRPEWLGNHPWILPASLAFLAVAVLLFLAQYTWFQKLLGWSHETSSAQPHTAPVTSSSTVTAPATATANGNVQKLEQHFHGMMPTSIPLVSPSPLEQPVLNEPGPDFTVNAKWVWLVYETVPGLWRESNPSDPTPRRSLIVYFTRNAPPKGERTTTAISLVPILRFKHAAGSEQIPRAYWLGRTNHEVAFDVGHHEAVVVGSVEGPLFSSYSNPHQFDGSHEYFSMPVRPLGERKAMPPATPISVEISLYDVYAKRTIEQANFEISVLGSSGSRLSVSVERK